MVATMKMVVVALAAPLVACSSPSTDDAHSTSTSLALPTAGTKEERINAAFAQAGIPVTPKGEHPAMVAFAVCLQRKTASHDDVVTALRRGDLRDFTGKQVNELVLISEQIWCPDTSLK